MSKTFLFILILIPVALIWLAVQYYGSASRDVNSGKVFIDGKEFDVEVADTLLARQQGLSGREELGEDEGMLFVFTRTAVHGFWMKDMLIPIDIIWIQGEEVIGFDTEIYPEPGVSAMNLTIYKPPAPVNFVLEVPAGTVERNGIQVGDSVSVRL